MAYGSDRSVRVKMTTVDPFFTAVLSIRRTGKRFGLGRIAAERRTNRVETFLSDEEMQALEAVRKQLGIRSVREFLRRAIVAVIDGVVPEA